MNNVSLTGRISKDAEVRATTTGKNVATFSMAVDRPFTFGEKKQTDFFNIVWWIKNTKMADYLMKGREVAVTGYIQTRSYEAKDGSKKYITEIVVNTLDLLGGSKKEHEVKDDDTNIPF